jgi:hypothetical protein
MRVSLRKASTAAALAAVLALGVGGTANAAPDSPLAPVTATAASGDVQPSPAFVAHPSTSPQYQSRYVGTFEGPWCDVYGASYVATGQAVAYQCFYSYGGSYALYVFF